MIAQAAWSNQNDMGNEQRLRAVMGLSASSRIVAATSGSQITARSLGGLINPIGGAGESGGKLGDLGRRDMRDQRRAAKLKGHSALRLTKFWSDNFKVHSGDGVGESIVFLQVGDCAENGNGGVNSACDIKQKTVVFAIHGSGHGDHAFATRNARTEGDVLICCNHRVSSPVVVCPSTVAEAGGVSTAPGEGGDA